MKRVEPSFNVGEFLQGARGAYEMILMAFEHGDIDQVAPFLSEDVQRRLLRRSSMHRRGTGPQHRREFHRRSRACPCGLPISTPATDDGRDHRPLRRPN